jgi:hypothetical protein
MEVQRTQPALAVMTRDAHDRLSSRRVRLCLEPVRAIPRASTRARSVLLPSGGCVATLSCRLPWKALSPNGGRCSATHLTLIVFEQGRAARRRAIGARVCAATGNHRPA